jgi:hypothetical protein
MILGQGDSGGLLQAGWIGRKDNPNTGICKYDQYLLTVNCKKIKAGDGKTVQNFFQDKKVVKINSSRS